MEHPPEESPYPPRRATDGLRWRSEVSGRSDDSLGANAQERPAPPPQPGAGRWRWGLAVSLLALAGGAVGGALTSLILDEPTSEEPAGQVTPGVRQAVEQSSAIMEAAARGRLSVVRIESTRRVQGRLEEDVGSGVVLDREGHILTNAHVVLDTDTLKVVLPDGSERPAILVGHDYPFTDVAVLLVGPIGVAPMETGDSSALVLGGPLLAIGNPLAQFDGSVTVGVVSGLKRRRIFDGVLQEDLIQTDAAINSGNSGGALLNLQGQFVGMPTAVLRQSQNSLPVEGIAFAIPSNRLLEVARRIIAEGASYPRPSLEAEVLDLTPEVIGRFARLAASEGGLVLGVTAGGAADKAGIVAGDIVTVVEGSPVDREHPFLNALLPLAPGHSVKVVLNRGGRIIEAEVQLAKRS